MTSLIHAALLSLCIVTAIASVGEPTETLASSRVVPGADADIEEFAWMAGHWRGEGFGGVCEEIWSEPLGGTMMGSFRLVKDDEVVFYELVLICEDDDGMAMKVKHFTKDFVAWEDKKGALRFALESVAPDEAQFSGLEFKRDGDALKIRLRMRSSDGKINWEELTFHRATPEEK